MTLTEAIMAVAVFSLSATSSVRLWASSAVWSQAAAAREALASGIEADLLRRTHHLRASVARDQPAPASCEVAAAWMVSRLASGASSLPQGVRKQLVPDGGAVWLIYTAAEGQLERRRLFSAAAHGLCPVVPELPAMTDLEVGA
ncbi:hypothetical protein KBY86_05275 [Synechococcus sp. Lug-A]|uniref:hypothetical protein n=1 Tax=Synechococcus sp. Lug-A TaxID=2823740 RepID=UPI0020CF3F9B|nr:hypothetical protein [Synechococcus sp. Lug-A]MCP9846302.1 hypothetical protein [Synechococcus sp. Lug-A]